MLPHGQATARQRRMLRVVFGVVLAAGSLPRAALAEPPAATGAREQELELSWSAPPECPNGAAVRRDIEEIAGKSGEIRREVKAQAEVKRSARGWDVTLLLVTDAGQSTRVLSAPSCRAVARASAVVIAFTMTTDDSTSDSGPPAPPNDARPVEVPTPPPSPAEPEHPAPPTTKRPARPTAAQVSATVGLFGRADIGTLPSLSAGPGILVGLHTRPIFLEATFGWLIGEDKAIVAPPDRQATISRADFSAFSARIGICPSDARASLAWWRLQIMGCVGFGALETRVTPRALGGAASTIEGWSGSAFVGPRARAVFGWLALSVSADAAVPFRRQEFVLLDRAGGAVTIHRSSAILVGVSLGVELTFFQ